MIMFALILQVLEIPSQDDKASHILFLQIIIMTTITLSVSLVSNWGGICIDALG